jgi:hypothetical protein
MHGYGITKSIEQRTRHGSTSSTRRSGRCASMTPAHDTAWGVSDGNRRAKHYSLT